jgi:hypothetical protein
VGSAVFVVDPAVFDNVSKFSVTAIPAVVRLTLPVPVSATTSWTTKVKEQAIMNSVDTRSGRARTKTAIKKMGVFMDTPKGVSPTTPKCVLLREH